MEAFEDGDREDLGYFLALKQLLDEGKHNTVKSELLVRLYERPDERDSLYFLARLLSDTGEGVIALPIAKHITATWPDWWSGWLLLGLCQHYVHRSEEAEQSMRRAFEISPRKAICGPLAGVLSSLGRYEEAKEWAEQDPDDVNARTALAFYHLYRREWGPGWDYFTVQMGRTADRPLSDYGLPEWQGKGSVLIYGEQGLGDQLTYAASTDERCTQLVCHPKLKPLLSRSLPCRVYASTEAVEPDAEYQASMTQAMRWQTVEQKTYLKPHPEKALQWRALMYTKALIKDRPWIGLAWTGGRKGAHGWHKRDVDVEALRPILDLPANFVSLEYRPHDDVPGVHQWSWATQTDDLDDFAALVSELTAVVCVPTTTYHVAGGLGVPCHVITHSKPHFFEGREGSSSPWWPTVQFQRGETGQVIADIAKTLGRYL